MQFLEAQKILALSGPGKIDAWCRPLYQLSSAADLFFPLRRFLDASKRNAFFGHPLTDKDPRDN